jgi:RNA polymerase sigma-70 factor (ECF subfamily)
LQSGVRGAREVARTFSQRARAAQAVLIDGEPGAIWVHDGEVRVAFRFGILGDRIATIALIADAGSLARLSIER